jgi:hypothetical protein
VRNPLQILPLSRSLQLLPIETPGEENYYSHCRFRPSISTYSNSEMSHYFLGGGFPRNSRMDCKCLCRVPIGPNHEKNRCVGSTFSTFWVGFFCSLSRKVTSNNMCPCQLRRLLTRFPRAFAECLNCGTSLRPVQPKDSYP